MNRGQTWLMVSLLVSGCGPGTSGGGTPDFSSGSSDLARTVGNPDLTTAANPDLTTTANPDLTTTANPDLTTAANPDLSVPPLDLFAAPPPDLRPASDLAAPAAFGSPCASATACAAPSGESGFCSQGFGSPVCLHTCDAQADYSLCENGKGICLPGSPSKICVPKCGDVENAICGAGASCAFLGYRDRSSIDAGFSRVGACLPDCSPTGVDACTGAGTTCDLATRACRVGCPGGCPTGATCQSAACVPNMPAGLYGSCTPAAPGVSNGCVDNLCFASGSNAGFCGIFCNTDSGDQQCGTGGTCWTDNNQIAPSSGGTISFPGGQFQVTGNRGAGACVKTCNDSADCPTGFYCGEFSGKRGCLPGALARFSPPFIPGIVPIGGVCRQDADCISGKCGKSVGYPGFADGLCQRPAAGQTCPANTFSEMDGLTCAPLCSATVDNSCPDSLVCYDNGAGTVRCVRGVCRDNQDCSPGTVCDRASNNCAPTLASGVRAVGAACTTDAQCGGYCIQQRATSPTYSNGYCTELCTLLPDLSDTCPSGALCATTAIGALGSCVSLCDTSPLASKFGICRTGYNCTAFKLDPRYGHCDSL